MRFLISGCAVLVMAATAVAQEGQSAFGITFSGFVKTDAMVDSRQTVAIREGHFLLYPSPILRDTFSTDINAKANFNMLSIQTRLQGKITGPDALGAKTSGLIEGEFFGTTDADISGFRLRHAYLRADWARSSLLIGQYWHPMFVVEMFPGVVSFNTGVPFQPFSRNPQVRFSYSVDRVKFIAAALAQRDFQSTGPAGYSSSYLRNSVLPNLHAQLQYANAGTLAGIGFDYKRITPRLVTTRNVATDVTIASTAFLGYVKLQLEPVTVKAEATYGGNLADHLMLGGYAVKSSDPVTGLEGYTVLRSYAVWGEIAAGTEVEYAVFAGYTKSLGASDNVVGTYYARGGDIDNVLRVSPRVVWNTGKLRFAAEGEYTTAAYGTPNSADNGRVGNEQRVENIRGLLAAFLFF